MRKIRGTGSFYEAGLLRMAIVGRTLPPVGRDLRTIMNSATLLSIVVTLMLPLGSVVHASDASFIIAQTLPGQLPGQKLPGQLPSAPAKPATAAVPPSALPAKTTGSPLAVPARDVRCVGTTMTSALFLKIDKVPGDSLDKCHRDEIELIEFKNSGSAITVTKRIDISSPRLYMVALEGRVMPEAILTVLESGSQGRILRYTMKNAVVNSVDQAAGSDNRETVQFRFGSLMTETEASTATAGSSPPRSVAVSFALAAVQTAASALNSGVSAGRFQDFVVVKPLDASSPKLMQAKQSGQVIPEIVITLRAGSDSFTYRLSNVVVASDVQQGSGSVQSETVHLKPSKVMLEYNSGSRPGAPVRSGWDVKANTKV